MVLANDARIKAIQEINYAEMTKKNYYLRDIALTWKYDKKASNLVSTFYVIDQSLTCTTCSTYDMLLILLSVIYKVINQLLDERKCLHTSMNQIFQEAQMTATAAQLYAVTTVHAKGEISVHKINAITTKHRLLMKDSNAMREKQKNQLVYLKSEVKSDQKNTPKVVSDVVREFQAETVAMKLDNNAKLLEMAVNQRNLNTSWIRIPP